MKPSTTTPLQITPLKHFFAHENDIIVLVYFFFVRIYETLLFSPNIGQTSEVKNNLNIESKSNFFLTIHSIKYKHII